MWVYSVTAATSAYASQAYQFGESSSSSSTAINTAGVSFTESSLTQASSEKTVTPWEETYHYRQRYDYGYTDSGGASTDFSEVVETQYAGYTRSSMSAETRTPAGTTTDSGETTTTRSMESYLAGTMTTNATGIAETTATQTATRTVVSFSDSETTAAVETITRTTSTTVTTAVVATVYSTRASTSILAPVMLFPVSVAEATEQAWQITATQFTAGYLSDIAATFAQRTGTVQTTTDALPIVPPTASYSTSFDAILNATTFPTLTLTTTATTQLVDTFVPFQSILPATATATRTIAGLTTQVTTFTYLYSWGTSTGTLRGYASDHDTRAVTMIELSSALVSVTINVNPTSTAAVAYHQTWYTSRTRAVLRYPKAVMTSVSAGTFGSSSSTFTDIVTTASGTAEETATDSSTATVTDTATGTELAGGLDSSSMFVEACGLGAPQLDTSSTSFVDGATSYSSYRTVDHQPPWHTFYTEVYSSGPVTTSSTYTTTELHTSTSTYAVTTEATAATTQTHSAASESYSYEYNGASFTYQKLAPQFTADAAADWTALQFHPRPGFIHPLELTTTTGVVWAMTVTPSNTIYYPFVATQAGSDGPRTPIVDTYARDYTTGSSIYTALWETSDSRLYWSSAVTFTYTTTIGATSITATQTGTSATATGAATLNGVSLSNWFHAQPTTADTQGSRIGGLAWQGIYAPSVYFSPGIRRMTHQIDGTSTSSHTALLTAPDMASESSNGYALPERPETVRHVRIDETYADIISDAVGPLGYTIPAHAFPSASPVVVLSLNPNF